MTMTRKLLISLAMNVPWAVWSYAVVLYNIDLPDALTSLKPLMMLSMIGGSGAMLGLTFRLYFPDTTRWTHILLLSITWAAAIVGSIAGLVFIFAIPVSVLMAMRLMRTRNYWDVSGFLFLAAEIVSIVLLIPTINVMANPHLYTDVGYESVVFMSALLGVLYTLAVHWMVVVSLDLKDRVTPPAPAEYDERNAK